MAGPTSGGGAGMIDALLGQAPAGGGGGGGGDPLGGPLFPLYLVGLLMLFMMVVVWPASRRARREEEKMRASLKNGMKVITGAGIVGTIVTAKDGEDEV